MHVQVGERERNWNAYLVLYERKDVTEALAAGRQPATLVKTRAPGADGPGPKSAAAADAAALPTVAETSRGQRQRSGSGSSDSSTASSASLVTRMNQLMLTGNSSGVFQSRMPDSIQTAVREDNIQFSHQRCVLSAATQCR